MDKYIDCLFIGHNEMQFSEYEKMVSLMGVKSGAYRDLNLNFIKHNNKLYTLPDIFNSYYYGKDSKFADYFDLGSVFSAAISYLSTYLHRRGHSFDFFNSFQKHKEALREKLEKEKVRAIVIPTTLYTSAFPILEIVKYIRTYNSTAKIIVGGPFIATQVRTQEGEILQYVLKSINADYYINSSQGEKALSNLIEAIKKGESVDKIKNIYYKNKDIYRSTETEIEDNQLSCNMVNWGLFAGRVERFVSIRTAISCPYSCSFCGFPQHAGKYQTAEVSAVEKELDTLSQLGTVKSVNFIDDTFNIPQDRFKQILRMMIKNKYNFNWNSYLRCQFIDRETVELMKESGCQGVFLGIESGSERILKNMNKAATIEKYREGIALLKEYGIITFASFIVGFPGETHETAQETIDFIEDNKPDFYRTQLWYCEPITPIWNEREKYGINGSQFEWSHNTMDSHTAHDIIDSNFLNIKNSIWLPQYNFDTVGIYNLMHRGMDAAQITDMIKAFNSGIKEKLTNENQKEVSKEIFENIKSVFSDNRESSERAFENNEESKYDLDFDFEA